MARQAAILSEDDEGNGSLEDLEALAPPTSRGGDAGSQQQSRAPEMEFEIVDTDDNFQPLNQRADQQQQTADPSLDEEENGGNGTYVDRQQRQQTAEQQQLSKSKQKRLRRQQGRDQTWQELEQLRRENEELKQRFSTIEPRLNQMTEGQARAEIGGVDRLIAENQVVFERAEDQIADALANNQPDVLRLAMRTRDKAVIDGQQLLVRKQILSHNLNNLSKQFQAAAQPRQDVSAPAAPAPLPVAVQRQIQNFAETHDWYDPKRPDRDSKIVLMLDNEVAEEGFDPTTPDYWQELEDRMREVLPHRFETQQPAPRNQGGQRPQQQQVATERRGPMTSGSGDRAPVAKPNQVYMNDQRRQALIQAGAMAADGKTVTDKTKFNRLLKSYQEFDRANGVVRQ